MRQGDFRELIPPQQHRRPRQPTRRQLPHLRSHHPGRLHRPQHDRRLPLPVRLRPGRGQRRNGNPVLVSPGHSTSSPPASSRPSPSTWQKFLPTPLDTTRQDHQQLLQRRPYRLRQPASTPSASTTPSRPSRPSPAPTTRAAATPSRTPASHPASPSCPTSRPRSPPSPATSLDLQHTYQITPQPREPGALRLHLLRRPAGRQHHRNHQPRPLWPRRLRRHRPARRPGLRQLRQHLLRRQPTHPTSWVGNTPSTTNRSVTYEFLDNLAWSRASTP